MATPTNRLGPPTGGRPRPTTGLRAAVAPIARQIRPATTPGYLGGPIGPAVGLQRPPAIGAKPTGTARPIVPYPTGRSDAVPMGAPGARGGSIANRANPVGRSDAVVMRRPAGPKALRKSVNISRPPGKAKKAAGAKSARGFAPGQQRVAGAARGAPRPGTVGPSGRVPNVDSVTSSKRGPAARFPGPPTKGIYAQPPARRSQR